MKPPGGRRECIGQEADEHPLPRDLSCPEMRTEAMTGQFEHTVHVAPGGAEVLTVE